MNVDHLGLNDIAGLLVIQPTGSRFNCDPPVMNTDQDYLIWAVSNIDADLERKGYVKNSLDLTNIQQMKSQSQPRKKGVPDDEFTSWRKGDINLIVTYSATFFEKHKIAGFVCKELNIRNKDHRILVYHAIMYGEYDGVTPTYDTPKSTSGIDFFAINKVFSI